MGGGELVDHSRVHAFPGIASRSLAMEIRQKQVHDENPKSPPPGRTPTADGHDEIQGVPTPARLVGIDSARHSEKAGNVHEIKRQVESDEEQPEVQFTERLVVHLSRTSSENQ